jgi:hypothetical protein
MTRRIKEHQEATADLAVQLKALGDGLGAQLRETDRLVRLPILGGLTTARVGRHEIQVKRYAIPGRPVDGKYWDVGLLPPEDWRPSGGELPYPYADWPPYQGAPFHPWEFLLNVTAVCNYARRAGSPAEVRPVLDRLLADLRPHLRARGPALFATYPFEYRIKDQRLAPGWVSAFGNAAVLAALVKLYDTTGDARHRELARGVAASFGQVREAPDQAEPWVAFVDGSGYLWFEEYPRKGEGQTRVLNGHVLALMALDSYLPIAGDDREAARLLLQAGLTTMHRYLSEYRRPGRVNRYGLGAPFDGEPDYTPTRTIRCAEWLRQVTGERFFADLADAFRQDHP